MTTRAESVFGPLRSKIAAPDSLLLDLDGQDKYFHDATDFHAIPAAILMAESETDVVAAVNYCREQLIPITVRGAGTGLSGGCVPSKGALLLSTEQIDGMEIRAGEKTAICGPGVITKDLVDAAELCGLTYPPDPASYAESTLGGNVAEGAGGLRCKRFGVTKDYVIGLRAVLADGSILRTGLFNDYQGFSIGDLLLASEGTLAIITSIAVRLIASTNIGSTILAAFADPRDAAKTVSDIVSAGIVPSVLEYLDGDAADCSNRYERTEGLDNAAAILLVETGDRPGGGQAAEIRRHCERNNCSYLRFESNPNKASALWKVRRNLSNAVKAAATGRISEDVAVPNSKFPVLVDYVACLGRETGIRINSYGHAGDGNLHVNFLFQADSVKEQSLVAGAIERLMHKTLDLGGTLSGEHGIGLAKQKYLSWEYDTPTLRAMKNVKSIFDPDGLLNPGKLFPEHI